MARGDVRKCPAFCGKSWACRVMSCFWRERREMGDPDGGPGYEGRCCRNGMSWGAKGLIGGPRRRDAAVGRTSHGLGRAPFFAGSGTDGMEPFTSRIEVANDRDAAGP